MTSIGPYSMVIDEDYLSPDLLVEKVQELYFNRQTYINAMGKSQQMNATKTITELLDGIVEENKAGKGK